MGPQKNFSRQEKIIFELFSGALQENPVRAPAAITGGALTRTGAHTGDYFWGIIFGGSTGKSCKSPGGYYMKKCLPNYFGNHFAVEGISIILSEAIFGKGMRRSTFQ